MPKIIIQWFLMTILIFTSPALYADNAGKENICAHCGMAIQKENRKYSIIQRDTDKPVSFDDIGCAVLWRDNQCTAIQMAFDGTAYVYDYYSEEEVGIADAVYVRSTNLKTPMENGIVAFKDKEGAEKFLAVHGDGTILTYDDLLLEDIE